MKAKALRVSVQKNGGRAKVACDVIQIPMQKLDTS